MALATILGRQPRDVRAVTAFRPTPEDRDRMRRIKASLAARGVASPTNTDCLRVALEFTVNGFPSAEIGR